MSKSRFYEGSIMSNFRTATGGKITATPSTPTTSGSLNETLRAVPSPTMPKSRSRDTSPGHTTPATPLPILSHEVDQSTPPSPHAAPAQLTRSRRIALVALATCAITMATGSSTSLNIALPTIQKDLHMAPTDLQWVASAFTLANGCLLLLSGRLADVHGRKMIFLVGMTWQAIWCLIAGFMKSGSGLIVARALAGAGAAMCTPSAIGIVAANFHGRARATAFAAFSAGAPVGGGLGNVLGGVLVSYTKPGWRATLWLFAGFGIIAAIWGYLVVPTDVVTTSDRRIDWVGAALITIGLVLLQFVISDGETASNGWKTPYIIALLIISVLLVSSFFFWEYHVTYRTTRQPLMRLALWTRAKGRLAAVYFIGFVAFMGFITISYHASLFFQNVQQLDAIQTTIRFLPMAVFGILYNVMVAKLITRVPTMYIIASGLLGTALANVLFALTPADELYWRLPFNAFWLSVMGADFLMATGSTFISAFSLADEQSVAGALFQTLLQLGGSFGLAITTVVANSVQNKSAKAGKAPLVAELDGLHASFWLASGFSFVALGIAVVSLRGMGTIGKNMQRVKEEVGTEELENHESDVKGVRVDAKADTALEKSGEEKV